MDSSPPGPRSDIDVLKQAVLDQDWDRAGRITAAYIQACLGRMPLEVAVDLVHAAVNDAEAVFDIPDALAGNVRLASVLGDIQAIREFVLALAGGDLSRELHVKGYLAGALKMLQANLKHLTWQTQLVAKGDFTQRVDFMGDFAVGFNSMVSQLAEAQRLHEESEERYRILSITDPLTGLFNRRQFFDQARMEFRRIERYFRQVAIFMMDIDRFKSVNDTHGHAVGDEVLREVAERLCGGLRDTDVAGRYGGEEFIVLLPETGQEEALAVAERIRLGIADKPVVISCACLPVTVSLGVSAYAGSGKILENSDWLLETVVKQADQALYQAKQSGRNRVAVYR